MDKWAEQMVYKTSYSEVQEQLKTVNIYSEYKI